MKIRFIYSFFVVALGAALLLGNANGRAAQAGRGNTGAPGDETNSNGTAKTCRTCHSTSSNTAVELSIDVLDGSNSSITNTGYSPGETYTVLVTLNATAGNPAAYGFQMIALNAAEGQNGDEVSTWANPDTHVKISTASSNGRTYAEHNGPNENTNMFSVNWTAPEAGSGDVTFYSCGNGVNLSSSTSGDAAACNTLTIPENMTSGASDLLTDITFIAYPNPVAELLNIAIDNLRDQDMTLLIFNTFGQRIGSRAIGSKMESFESIDVADWPAGTYILQLTNGKESVSRKFWKQ